MRGKLSLIGLLVTSTASAQHPHRAAGGHVIGEVRFPISCSRAAQPVFDSSVALLHSFAFVGATRGFESTLRADSTCAMAWWGLAVTAWGNPFAAGIKPPAVIGRGLQAIQRARAIGAPTPRETGYIEAAAKLYEGADSIGQRARLLRYRDAMTALATAEPADTEATIFQALSLVISADPTDKSYANQLQAGTVLERLFVAQPNHPGLAHYIIHTYDVPPLAGRALDAAQRYSKIAPTISHALHMPSHTYTRVGSWQSSIAANLASATAARTERSTAEELHATDYRVYASLQLGQDRVARRIVDSLPGQIARFDPAALGSGAPPAAGFFAIAAIPARYALERGDWAGAAKLEVRPSPTPFADAITWFARGLGAARSGDTAGATEAIASLERLRDGLNRAGEAYWTGQVEIQRVGVVAWRALAAGRTEEAIGEMTKAAQAEDATEKNAITPGPLAPARELLGEMLLAAGRPAEALTAFESVLGREPNRYRTMAGAAQAAGAAHDQVKARKYRRELTLLGAHGDRK